MTQDGTDYYLAAAVLGVAWLAKSPGLVREWRSPTVRTVNLLLFLPCVGFFLASPPTISAVNRLTGISNVSAVLVYCVTTTYACACLVLLDYWRGGSEECTRTRRRVRVWKTTACVVIVALVVCFVLGDAPVEQRVEFDTYYATTPFIREMVVLYLLAYVAASVATTVVCWTWMLDIGRRTAHQPKTAVDASLRVGMLVLVTAGSINIVFGALKLTAVGARWADRNWDSLNNSLSLLITLNFVIFGIGLLVPAYGPGLIDRVWSPLRAISALRPLWRLVRRTGAASGNGMLLSPAWYAGPEQVLLHRLTTIHDWMLDLCVHCPDEVRELAYRRAKESGATEREAAASGIAAMFTAAAAELARESPPVTEHSAVAMAAVKTAEAADPNLLVSISRALAGARR